MTPTPMARAVEAMKVALHDHGRGGRHCGDDSDTGFCSGCLTLKLRAAGPLYLEAVVKEMDRDGGDRWVRWPGGPGGVNRAALLAALTDAAGRVG